jgi:hypothetical protein
VKFVSEPLATARVGTRDVSGSRGRVISWGLVLVTAMSFALSGGVLWVLGINYDGLTGSAAAKIHPATYLTFVLLFWATFSSPNPVGYIVSRTQRRPASALLMVIGVGLAAITALRGGTGIAGSIDTWASAGAVVLLLAGVTDIDLRRLEAVVHALMVANALLGVYEFVTGTLVFPYRFDGEVFSSDTRSTALQGHPLTNALVTAVYDLSLMAGGGPSLSPLARGATIVLQSVALVTFGGRTASVVTVALGGVIALAAVRRLLQVRRVPVLAAAALFYLAAVVPIAGVLLAVEGFFDKLALRFITDGGSANARVEMFSLLDHFSFRELLFGPDNEVVDSMRRISGLEWGIENPIIHMLLYQGVFITAVVAAGFVLFIIEVLRQTRGATLLPLAAFLILINSAESVAAKTTIMTKFALMMVVLFPKYLTDLPRRGRARR